MTVLNPSPRVDSPVYPAVNELDRQMAKSGEFFVINGDLMEISPIFYSFKVKVCNFLGKCGSPFKKVSKLDVTRPIVTIIGDQILQIRKDHDLILSTDAYFQLVTVINPGF